MKTTCGNNNRLGSFDFVFCLACFGLMLPVLASFGCSSANSQAHEVVRAGEGLGSTAGISDLFDLKKRSLNPFQATDAKAIVFVFVRTDCPISNRYAPEIQRLFMKYAPQGIAFWLVYSDPDTRPAEISSHTKEYQLSLGVLLDPRHALVKKAGVCVTPEVAVFFPDGREVYRGRIDNRHIDFGKERPAPTQQDLDEALISILSGKPVTNPTTRAVGCYIPELP